MHVVVTGGTGFVGSWLVPDLLDAGHRVTVLTRGDATSIRGGAEARRWDPRAAGDWFEVIDGADAVVHLAGKNLFDARWSEAHLRECKESRVQSTALIAQAIARAARKPKVFVSCSAVGYYGMKRGSEVLDESSPPGESADPLVDITVAWENAAEPARAAGVRVVHPRMGIVLGRGQGVLGKMEPPFRAFVGGPLGDGEQYVPWIHVIDASRALSCALENEAVKGAFNVSAPNPVTMNDLARTLGEVLHRPSLFRVPKLALKIALGAAAEAVLTGQRAIPRALRDAGFEFRFADLEPALRHIFAA